VLRDGLRIFRGARHVDISLGFFIGVTALLRQIMFLSGAGPEETRPDGAARDWAFGGFASGAFHGNLTARGVGIIIDVMVIELAENFATAARGEVRF
jgi:hypothetical protein